MKTINLLWIIALLLADHDSSFTQMLNGSLPAAYLEEAARNNPEIIAAYSNFQAAVRKIPQVSTLPDPQATAGYFIKPMMLPAGDQIASLQLMQMFPWFGTLKAAGKEAYWIAQAEYERYQECKADVLYRLKASWYQLKVNFSFLQAFVRYKTLTQFQG